MRRADGGVPGIETGIVRVADIGNRPFDESVAPVGGSVHPDQFCRTWRRRVDIVHTSASNAGRDPESIEVSASFAYELPETDAEAATLLEDLAHWADLGVRHYVLDFGHPKTPEHIHRFAEQVMAPLRQR